MRTLLSYGFPFVLVAIVASCGGDDDNSTSADAGTDDDAGAACPTDTPDFVADPTRGMLAVGQRGLVQARLVTASAVPPQRYENTWTIALTDAQGAPLDNDQVAAACAFMPIHGHGAPPRQVNKQAQPGSFQLVDLNLFMAGPWEIQLAIGAPGAPAELVTSCPEQAALPGSDYLVFHVCVRDE